MSIFDAIFGPRDYIRPEPRNVIWRCWRCTKIYDYREEAETCVRSHPEGHPPVNEDR